MVNKTVVTRTMADVIQVLELGVSSFRMEHLRSDTSDKVAIVRLWLRASLVGVVKGLTVRQTSDQKVARGAGRSHW